MQHLKSPSVSIGADIFMRIICWMISACSHLFLTTSIIEKLPVGVLWLCLPAITSCLIVFPLLKFKDVAVARDVIDIVMYEILYYLICIWFYLLSTPMYIKIQEFGYNTPFTYMFLIFTIRICWLQRNKKTQTFVEWPTFGITSFFFTQRKRQSTTTKFQKFTLASAVIVAFPVAQYVEVIGFPLTRSLLAVVGFYFVCVYAKSMYDQLNVKLIDAESTNELRNALKVSEQAIEELQELSKISPEIKRAVDALSSSEEDVRAEMVKVIEFLALSNKQKDPPKKKKLFLVK